MNTVINKLLSNSFTRSSVIYLLGSIVSVAVPVLLLPILTRYLTPTDYGIVATSTVFVQIFAVFLGLNSQGLIGRSHFDGNLETLRNLISTIIVFASILIFPLSVFVLVSGHWLENLTKFPSSWIPALIFLSYSTVLRTIYLSLVQARKKPKTYIKFQIAGTTLDVGLSVIFVVLCGMDWKGRMLGVIISLGTIAGFSFYGLTKKLNVLRPVFKKESLRELFSFGIPLIPHFIGGWVMTMVARLYLNNMASISDTGLFSLAFNMASPIAMVVGAANQAYWPALFDKISSPSVEKLPLARILLIGAAALLGGAFIYAFAVRWFLPVIVGPRFYGAATYIFWLSLAFAMQGVYFIFGNFVIYSKRTSLMSWRADFLGGIVTLILCPLLIYLNGPIGAAQATFIAFTVSTIGCFIASTKAYPMPWKEAVMSFFRPHGNFKVEQKSIVHEKGVVETK